MVLKDDVTAGVKVDAVHVRLGDEELREGRAAVSRRRSKGARGQGMALHGRERRRGITHLVKALPGVFLGAGVEAGPLGAGLAAEETAGVGRCDFGEAGGVGLAVALVAFALGLAGHGRRLSCDQEAHSDGGEERLAQWGHGGEVEGSVWW